MQALPSWLVAQFRDRGALIIFPMAVLALAAIAILVRSAIAQGPLPTTRVEGRITGMGFADIKGRGSVLDASVEVEGLTIRVETPARLNCRVGDAIALDRVSGRRGLYTLAAVPTPCTR